jgi:diaminopimelate epimerase
MKKYSFYKMNGAGNDFIVFDKDKSPDLKLNPGLITKLCDRRYGIGADGVIVVNNTPDYDFDMQYFNADGSTTTLCGNGARCAIKFAYNTKRLKGKKTIFSSIGETYTGEVLNDDEVKFNLNTPKIYKYNFKIKAAGQLINASFTDTGSPHVVIKINDMLKNPVQLNSVYLDLADLPVYDFGKEIRYSKDFAPGGTNVNFIQLRENKIFIRTYERGVENETLACGTGSVAAALICYATEKLKPPITLITKGGNSLIVDFEVENQKVKNLSLTGPAEINYTGEFFYNNYI